MPTATNFFDTNFQENLTLRTLEIHIYSPLIIESNIRYVLFFNLSRTKL